MNIEKCTTFGGYNAKLITAGDKIHYMNITDYDIDPNTKYEFRYVTKCAAGFMVINDGTGTIHRMTRFQKNTLQSAQIKHDGIWLTIFAVKSGRLVTCDKGLLDVMIPNDFHQMCPKMVSGPLFKFWENNGITNATPYARCLR
jgi:hypothetical protein